ncbi:hypothetical protein AHiyo8_60130 [Arthrobacter sp. Hiyo8]|nr:hypothetical protein AHiyo8_60130 [Arthrobacter sp. Hiyo8]
MASAETAVPAVWITSVTGTPGPPKSPTTNPTVCASKPTGAYQIQTAPGVWRAPSQPNPRPFTSPAAASKPKDKPKVAVQQSILRPNRHGHRPTAAPQKARQSR